MKRFVTALALTILAATLFFRQPLSAADTDFPIYFENSTLALKSQTFDKTTYLPLVDIVKHLGLAYSDATVQLTFTVQGQGSKLLLTPGSSFVLLNDRPILLQNSIRRENGQWFVPLDFLSNGLSRVAGIEFKYRPGDPRLFAGNVTPAELSMNVQSLGATTRLTLRAGTRIDVQLQRDAAQHRTVLLLKGKPIDPGREKLDYKDRLVTSVAFEDDDGIPRIVVGTTDEVRDIKVTPAEENRLFFVDFIREAAVTEAAPAPTPAQPAAPGVTARPDALPANAGNVKVIVIDPGHGGVDAGSSNASAQEKELTLAIARRLRTALQSRLGASVVLTRDSDILLSSEARAAVANNNQAGLFVSLHVGYSPNKNDSGSSIYVMKSDFTGGTPNMQGQRLFLPWYMAYRTNQQASQSLASSLQQSLNQTLPGWKFPVRSGPIGVLASVTMPAVAIELGNLNNDVSAQTLADAAFQTKLATTIAETIERFTEARR